jgi:NAD(P)-dependent dehydrogenase (short-subunit alcohol dehydrogenase family)
MRELRGRVAAITGAAQGIGKALALEFARAGMHIALADIDAQRLARAAEQVEALGVRAIRVPTDVRDLDAVERLLRRTVDELGSVQLMINNAGVFHGALLLDSPAEQWQRVIDTNLWGVVHGCRVFGAHFAAQGLGHIVNTASAAGLLATPGMSSYTTSKFAVVGLSQQLRWEMAGQGVGVTCVCPGIVKTDIGKAEGVGLEHVDMEAMLRRSPSPEKLAKKVLRAVVRDRPLVLYGAESYLASVLRLLPATWLDPLGRVATERARKMLQGARSRA